MHHNIDIVSWDNQRLQGSRGLAQEKKRQTRQVTECGDVMRQLQWCWLQTSSQKKVVQLQAGADNLCLALECAKAVKPGK